MDAMRLRQARKLFVRPDVPVSTARHNMREWVRAIRVVRATARGWRLDCPVPCRGGEKCTFGPGQSGTVVVPSTLINAK